MSNQFVQLFAIADTHIARDRPSSVEGFRGSIWAASGQFPPGSPVNVLVRQALVKFDVSSIPQGSTILDVKLRFQHFFYEKDGNDFVAPTVTAGQITSQEWDENSTWDSIGGPITGVHNESTTEPSASSLTDWVTEEMITIVDGWVNQGDPNHGFAIKTTGPQDLWIAYSREYAYAMKPTLEITYRE